MTEKTDGVPDTLYIPLAARISVLIIMPLSLF